MAIEITSLKQLDATKVAAMIAQLTQLMAESHPEVELTRGVFHDLVLYFDGVLNAAIQENITRLQQSNSLLDINTDPTLADTSVVDQVLSNYNITRDNGTPATGVATVIFHLNVTTAIAANVRLTAADTGVVFQPTEAFVILRAGNVATAANERVMIPVGDGTYAANITVQATTIGAAGNIRRGVKLTPNSVLNNTADVYANTDFIHGRDASSNAEYLTKLAPALAAKTIGSRQSYTAAILNQPAFSNTLHVSVLGCGDPEQQRDQHSLFPVSGGGKVDIYVQTSDYAQLQDHLLEATYMGGNQWQLILPRDTAPGFYEVTRIARAGDTVSSGYGVAEDIRNIDFLNTDFVPDVLYLHEGTYTRYQNAVIRFNDTDAATSSLVANESRALYVVTTSAMPLIAEMQDFLSSRANRSRSADILVKAAVPCFTKISFEIRTQASDPTPPVAEIQAAVSAAVSKIGFSGQLHASVITNVVHDYLTGQQAVSSIDMFGKIRRPNGDLSFVRDSAILRIPTDPERLVTGRTTVFLTSPQDVSISVVAAGFLN